MPLATAACVVIVPDDVVREPDRFVDLLARQRVTVLNQVPSVFRYVADAYLQAGTPTLDVRHVIFGGEAIDLDVIAACDAAWSGPKPCWTNMNGITETTVHVTHRRLEPADLERRGPTPIGPTPIGPTPIGPTPIGRPLPHLRAHLRGKNGEPVDPGDRGELWISGAGVSQGSLSRPALTAEQFVEAVVDGRAQRCYRNGDLARSDASGDLEYVGRLDDQIQLRGFRIELGEIEHVARQHSSVRQAAAAIIDTAAGEALACVLMADGASITVTELRHFLGQHLPLHVVPQRLILVEALPTSPSGKIDRRAIAQLATRDEIPRA